MKRLTFTLLLAGVATVQAQSLSPLYAQYLQAAAQVQTREQANEDLRLLTANLGRSYNKAETASKAYVCATYVAAFLKVHPNLASAQVDMNDFEGSFQELQEDCQAWYDETSTHLPDENNAARAMADISISHLIIEGAGSRQKLAEQQAGAGHGNLGWEMLSSTVQLELLLNAYPAYRDQRLELGSTPVGTGGRVLADSQAALQATLPLFVRGSQQRQDAAAAETEKDTMQNVNRLLNAYKGMLAGMARAEALLKQKEYKEAGDVFYAVNNAPYTESLDSQQQLLAMKINKQVTVNGKTMSFNELVNALYALTKTAETRARFARGLENKEMEQVRAAWRQAAASSLKGDKLAVYQRVGLPVSVVPDYRLNNARIKESMGKMVGATAWYYNGHQIRYPQSFYCSVTYFFKGNKLTGTRVSASPAALDFTRECENMYQMK